VGGRAVDPSFVKASEATGGQVFLFDRSEAGRSLVVMKYSRTREDTIWRATDTLSTGVREFSFPVDSTVESLLVSVSVQCRQSITLYRPTNTEVRAGDPEVEENQLKSGLITLLTRPAAGTWRVRLAGVGMFFAVVTAKSSISIDSAEFVEPGGRPGHEGLFPVKGPVHMGEQRTMSARLTAPTGQKHFRVVDFAGQTLESLDLKPSDDTGSASDFLGEVVLKHPEFRLAVQGVDEAGYPYQRILARSFEVRTSN